jgi:hypothetical protein
MRRLLDVVLIVLFLGAVGFGAYKLGHRVDHLSNQAASQDSELNQPTTTSAVQPTHRARLHQTPIIVAAALGGTVVMLIVASALGSFARSRRREHWRAPYS